MGGDDDGYDPAVGPEPWSDEPGDEADPFEGLNLDEEFVRAAPVREPTAADRARAAREAELSRLLSEEESRSFRRLPDHPSQLVDEFEDHQYGRARSRRRRTLQVLAILLVAALVLVYVVADLLRPGSSRGEGLDGGGATPEVQATVGGATREASATEDAAPSDGALGDTDQHLDASWPAEWPPEPVRISDEPLGEPGPVPAGGGPHAFAMVRDDGVTPVGWDPCRPISYVTRPGSLDVADRLVDRAVQMVSAATGLQFVDEGTTDESPSEDRSSYQPDRYGERWAPVLIAWSDAEESPRLGRSLPDDPTADVAGYASSRSAGFSTTDPRSGRSTEGGQVLVSGSVVLDEEDLGSMLEQPDGFARAGAVVAHEFAHLVGLGHVADPSQLMHPSARPSVTTFGPGDLEGLARLGTLDCFPQI